MERSKTGIKLALGAAAVGIVALAAIVALGGNGQPNASEAEDVAAGASGPAAPALDLHYLDGDTGTLADLRGTPVVLNFFADWCPACVAEMPDFQAVHEAFAGDVVFVGLDRSTSDAGAQALITATGITYDVALDRDGSLFQAFSGISMPTTIFLNAQGEIVDRHNGVIFEDDLRDRVEALIADA